MHKLNLIQGSGDQFDHRIFKSQSLIKKKLPPEFPAKKEILELINSIETERNALCYGSRKSKQRIEKIIENFQDLRKIINRNLKEVKDESKK